MSKYEQLLHRLFSNGRVTLSIELNGKLYAVEYTFAPGSRVTTWVDGIFLHKWTELSWPTAPLYPEGRFLCLHFTTSGSQLSQTWFSPDQLIDHIHRYFPDFELVHPRKPILRIVRSDQPAAEPVNKPGPKPGLINTAIMPNQA